MSLLKVTGTLTATAFTAQALIVAPDPTFITTVLGIGILGVTGILIAKNK